LVAYTPEKILCMLPLLDEQISTVLSDMDTEIVVL
jgi:hypothetical protein